MNPYASTKHNASSAAKSSAASAVAARHHAQAHALFAAEVYEDDGESTIDNRDDDGRQILGEEIARLRMELRGETRALRSALTKPRVPSELLAELATLRAAVGELFLAGHQSGGDPLSLTIRKCGLEGPAAAALARSVRGQRATATVTTIERLRHATPSVVETALWMPALFDEGPALIALVGPAGVGKTTTAAKLAARARMAKKSVALVTCDSFRVGAMDQLEKYADLLDARFHTATSQEELLDIICCEDADVIIVDTSGRAIQAGATEAILASEDIRMPKRNARNVEVLLCVPASLRASDADRVSRDFAIAMPTSLAITKIDETDTPAGIAHAAFATKLPVSTLCMGQRVPEDIAPATDDAVASHLFPLTTSLTTTDEDDQETIER